MKEVELLFDPSLHNHKVGKDGLCGCQRLLRKGLTAEELGEELFNNAQLMGDTPASKAPDRKKLKKLGEFNLKPLEVVITHDRHTSSDDYELATVERKRAPLNAIDKMDSGSIARTFPPINIRRCKFGLLSSAIMKQIVENANAIAENVHEQRPLDVLAPGESSIVSAIKQCNEAARNDERFEDIAPGDPFLYEYQITECNSAWETVTVENLQPTKLEVIAQHFHLNKIDNIKVIGNIDLYYYGTGLVLDDNNMIWPDDRTISRCVIHIGDFFSPVDYIGKSGSTRLDRAVEGLLIGITAKRPDYDGRKCGKVFADTKAYIDLLADVISTVFNALRKSNQEELDSIREGNSRGYKAIKNLCCHHNVKIKQTFSVLERVCTLYANEKYPEASKLAMLAHIFATAQDVYRYRSPKQRIVNRIFEHNWVIWKLGADGMKKVSKSDIPIKGDMDMKYLGYILMKLNEALAGEMFPIAMGNAHATADSDDWCVIKEEEISVGGLTVGKGQPRLLTDNRDRYLKIEVQEGVRKGECFTLILLKSGLQVIADTDHSTDLKESSSDNGEQNTNQDFHSELLNLSLSGACGLAAARWVATAIWCGILKVSKLSTASYVPKLGKVEGNHLPVVSVPLCRGLSTKMAVFVNRKTEKVYMKLSKESKLHALRADDEKVRLEFDMEVVDIEGLEMGVLKWPHQIA